jgi:hypothetical protein
LVSGSDGDVKHLQLLFGERGGSGLILFSKQAVVFHCFGIIENILNEVAVREGVSEGRRLTVNFFSNSFLSFSNREIFCVVPSCSKAFSS